MRDIVNSLLQSLKSSSGPARAVVAAGVVLLLAALGVTSYRAANPHMVPLYTGLDDSQFGAVTAALSNARVRFETSSPPGPYSVFVAESQKYDGLNAIHAAGALEAEGRGIPTAASSSTIFMGHDERTQLTRKRDWEDLEKQLEALAFVQAARVRTSTGPRSALRREEPPTVSVVVTLRGNLAPTEEQRQTLAAIVRNATNVPDENIAIADHLGNSLFDGSRDRALDAIVEFELDFAEARSRRAQELLDRTFGAGMSVVSVTGEWNHDRTESVDEALDPTKLKVSETTSETKTPLEGAAVGGPAGTASSIDQASTPARADVPVAETLDSDVRYAYSTKTTHRVQEAPELVRLSVTLLIDESLAGRLPQAEQFVKQLVGFQEGRDLLTASALPLASVERDDEGNPVPPAAPPAPEPKNETLSLLLERGVEMLAAAAFLIVLVRSLRRGAASAPRTASSGDTAGGRLMDAVADEDVDLDALARKQVEHMIEHEPERVGALLSRWALGESFYAGAKQ